MAIEHHVTTNVETLLRQTQWTQRALSEALHLSQPAVSDRMRGRTPWTLADVESLADLFDVDPLDLMGPVQR